MRVSARICDIEIVTVFVLKIAHLAISIEPRGPALAVSYPVYTTETDGLDVQSRQRIPSRNFEICFIENI